MISKSSIGQLAARAALKNYQSLQTGFEARKQAAGEQVPYELYDGKDKSERELLRGVSGVAQDPAQIAVLETCDRARGSLDGYRARSAATGAALRTVAAGISGPVGLTLAQLGGEILQSASSFSGKAAVGRVFAQALQKHGDEQQQHDAQALLNLGPDQPRVAVPIYEEYFLAGVDRQS